MEKLSQNNQQIGTELISSLTTLSSMLPEVMPQISALMNQIKLVQQSGAQQPKAPGQTQQPSMATQTSPIANQSLTETESTPGIEPELTAEAISRKFKIVEAQGNPQPALDATTQKYLSKIQILQSFDFNALWKNFNITFQMAQGQPQYFQLSQSVIACAQAIYTTIEQIKEIVMNPRNDMFTSSQTA